MSLALGVVPCKWKEANITPVFKRDDPTLAENYRPISLLCILSKVLERCVYNHCCYIASAETKRDWLVHGHVALDKCNVSLGQQVNNCCPLRPAPYMNKQNGGETRKFINSDFRAFCLKKYTISREDMPLKLKFNYSSKFWLF